MRKRRPTELKIPEKANRILNGILVVLILIVVRIWHVAVVQHDQKIKESKRPQERTVIERAERATIRDRFGTPLAINKVQYNAYLNYAPIRELPRNIWKKDEKGKKVKFSFRKEYITELCSFLGNELNLDPERIEDIIHSKAAILGNVPCLIKENISEDKYFKIKMLEKDWPGIYAEIAPKRCYPLGAVGGEVIGYLGPISRNEYESLTQELRELREMLQKWEDGERLDGVSFLTKEEIKARIDELEKKAYTINDYVGKTGIEASFDESLRGQKGKHIYLSDTRGNHLHELPGSMPPTPGDSIVLTISSELQEYAERLLAEYEASTSQRAQAIKLKTLLPENQPWIKGGAIVAMHPKTGDIYALASFPRFNPNDFILTGDPDEVEEKKKRVHRWLEDEKNVAQIWNYKAPLMRERFNPAKGIFEEEEKELSWKAFLSFILPKHSPVRQLIEEKSTLKDAVWMQRKVEQLVSLFTSDRYSITPAKVLDFLYKDGENIPIGVMITLQERDFFEERLSTIYPQVEGVLQELFPFFKNIPLNYEKLLLTDLYRIGVDARKFSPLFLESVGSVNLSEYRELSARFYSIREALKKMVFEQFSELDFKKWREENFKSFLAEKRKEEKDAKSKYARPFIEYLDKEKWVLFEKFWKENEWDFLAAFLTKTFKPNSPEILPYVQAIGELAQEIESGAHSALDWVHQYKKVRALLEKFHFAETLTLLQTIRSFEELDRPLVGVYKGLKGNLEKHLASAFYPTYGFGYARSQAFRSATTIGSIFKLVSAYEALKQKFLAGDETGDLNPLTMTDDKHRVYGKGENWNVGYDADGKAIPMFYKGGRLPRSEHPKIGKIDLPHALETSSNPYFSIIAGEILEDPEDLLFASNLLGFGEKTKIDLPGEYAGRLPQDIVYNRTGLYAMAIGQHSLCGTPLQAAVMLAALANGGEILKPKIVEKKICPDEVNQIGSETRWRIFLPPKIQHILLSALRQVVMGEKGTARGLKKLFPDEFVKKIVGKTSTAESIERVSLDGTMGTLKLNHVWFGAIAYETEDFSKPEVVVIVYLRLGEYGKDAAPMAAKIIQKWQEIKNRSKTSKSIH